MRRNLLSFILLFVSFAAFSQTYNMSNSTDTTCSGFFYDSGGQSGNYGANENLVKTFTSANGKRIKFDFATFSLGTYDYLRIYDGNSTSAPLINEYRGSSNPGIIESSGSSITFHFYSNNSTYNLGPGWEAQISCSGNVLPVVNMDNQSDTINHIMFYDHEGFDANYASYSNYTHTLIADSNQFLKAEFNNIHTNFGSGDTLWVYDGNSISAPLLGVFIAGSFIEDIQSSGDALTFRFTSDHTSQSRGWQAEIYQTNNPAALSTYNMSAGIRVVCDAIFKDNGGNSNYSDNLDLTQTFIAKPNNRLKIDFSQFNTAHSYDYLKIYDGISTSATLIGTYSGSNSPGIVFSSDSALTFVFHSNYTSTSSGWQAQFSCIDISPVIITQQSSNQQVCPGDTVNLSIKAVGGDTINYVWKKDGQIINGENDSILTIYNIDNNDIGFYKCIVSNPYGTDSTSAISLNLLNTTSISINLNPVCFNDSLHNLSGASPSGGIYFGANISNNKIDLSTAGIGNHIVNYKYTNQNGCSSYIQDTLVVNPLPQINFTAIGDVCEGGNSISLNQASPNGGVYYGNGVSASSFNPVIAGVGTHQIYYSYTDQNNCTATENQSITVNPNPNVVLNSLNPVCVNSSSFPLSGGSPTGGTYSGTGVTNGIFDPSSAAVGFHPILYTYTNSNGCSAQDIKVLEVYSAPNVSFNINSDFCIDDSPLTLSSGSPSGGNYSGNGIINGVFYPSVAGIGNHNLTYSYSDSNSCTAIDTVNVEVHAKPNVSLANFSNHCSNEADFALYGGTPAAGVYSGQFVSNNIFSASASGVGSFNIVYTYTDSFGCSNTDNKNITILNAPTASIDSIPDFCENHPSFNLIAAPSGGSFSGNGVSASSFNPQIAGAGSHIINYTYTASNGCTAIDSSLILVNPLPSVSLNFKSDFCENDSAFVLNGGLPIGGLYSGNAVNNGVFFPNQSTVGSHFIFYNYIDSNGCANSDSNLVSIHSQPLVSFSNIPDLCLNSGDYILNVNPTGGVFNGPGIVDSILNPQIAGSGNHLITYSYSDSNSCTTTDSQYVIINPIPYINLGQDTSIGLSKILVLDAGSGFSSYLWSDSSNNQSYDFIAMDQGIGNHYVWINVSDSNNCNNSDTIHISVFNDTGIDELNKMNIKVFPNPFNGKIEVSLDTELFGELQLTTLDGKIVKRRTIENKKKIKLETQELAKGIYILRIIDKDRILVFKLIKS